MLAAAGVRVWRRVRDFEFRGFEDSGELGPDVLRLKFLEKLVSKVFSFDSALITLA